MSEFKSTNIPQQVSPAEAPVDTVVNTLQHTLDLIKDQLEITDSRVGEFLIYKNDQVISQAIKLFGEYCHAEVTIMSRYLTENSCMLDIGTNIGYHAVGVHKQTNCQVIGFEPNPKHFAVASYNSRGSEKIQIINGAASNKKQTFLMKDFDPGVESNYGDIHKTDIDGQIEVQAITIDSCTLNRCQFMKIDVEGHELEALEGSKKTISKSIQETDRGSKTDI
jgi:FkbM family methyltransferase